MLIIVKQTGNGEEIKTLRQWTGERFGFGIEEVGGLTTRPESIQSMRSRWGRIHSATDSKNLKEVEKATIKDVIFRAASITEAAAILGITRMTIHCKIKKYETEQK